MRITRFNSRCLWDDTSKHRLQFIEHLECSHMMTSHSNVPFITSWKTKVQTGKKLARLPQWCQAPKSVPSPGFHMVSSHEQPSGPAIRGRWEGTGILPTTHQRHQNPKSHEPFPPHQAPGEAVWPSFLLSLSPGIPPVHPARRTGKRCPDLPLSLFPGKG